MLNVEKKQMKVGSIMFIFMCVLLCVMPNAHKMYNPKYTDWLLTSKGTNTQIHQRTKQKKLQSLQTIEHWTLFNSRQNQ